MIALIISGINMMEVIANETIQDGF